MTHIPGSRLIAPRVSATGLYRPKFVSKARGRTAPPVVMSPIECKFSLFDLVFESGGILGFLRGIRLWTTLLSPTTPTL